MAASVAAGSAWAAGHSRNYGEGRGHPGRGLAALLRGRPASGPCAWGLVWRGSQAPAALASWHQS